MTPAEIAAALNKQGVTPDHINAMDAAEMQQSKSTGVPLQGGVSNLTPEQEATATKYSQGYDNPLVAGLKMPVLGAAAAPEELGNLALGVGESVAGVPQENRMTVGDLIRRATGAQGLVTPGEFMRTPQLQEQLGKNPVSNFVGNVGGFAGGMAMPMGPLGKLGELAGPAAKFIGGMAPKLAGPIAQGALRGGISGAPFAAAFGAGGQFGQNKTLPNLPQAAQMGAAGAVMGTGLGAGASMLGPAVGRLANRMMGRGEAPAAVAPPAQAQTPQGMLNQAVQGNPLLSQQGLSEGWNPATMQNKYEAMLKSAESSGADPARVQQVQKDLIARAKKRYNGQGQDYQQAVSKVELAQAKSQTRQVEKSQNRQYSQAQVQDRRNYSEGQKAQGRMDKLTDEQRKLGLKHEEQQAKRGEKGAHTETSGRSYRELYDQIEGAADENTLRALEQDIHDPGMSPDGERILDSPQQSNLMKQFYRRMRELRKKDPESGETSGGGAGPSPSPVKPEGPKSQEKTRVETPEVKPEQAPNSAIDGGTPKNEKADPAAIEKFVAGVERKTLSPELMKPENRYKVAVTPEALGRLGKLSAAETTALKEWTKSIADNAVDTKSAKNRMSSLVEWALENAGAWEPKQGEFTQMWLNTKTPAGTPQSGIAIIKAGELKHLFMNVKMQEVFEKAADKEIELKKSQLFQEGAARGDSPKMVVDENPSMSATVNGVAEEHFAKENGGLRVTKMNKFEQPFVPPKNLEELYRRANILRGQISHLAKERDLINTAQGEHDLLGNGTRPIQVLEKAFKARKDIWAEGNDPSKVPTAHVWHVDDMGNVVTVRFERQKQKASFGEAMQDLEVKYDQFVQALRDAGRTDTKNDYSSKLITDADIKKIQGSLRGFTGLEGLIAAHIAMQIGTKATHKVLSAASKAANLQALTVGTTDNIIKAKTEWDGHKISASTHLMLGRILDAFGRDQGSFLHRIKGAEDLTDLLNQFKGVKINLRAYVKHAIDQSIARGETSQEQINVATKKALTAHMVRREYDAHAKELKPLLDELAARKADIANRGNPLPKERARAYRSDQFDNKGKLLDDVYDRQFHDALQSLHDGLTLNPHGSSDGLSDLIGRMASRKNASIFGNNLSTGVGNFFDAGIPTLAEFHGHFLKAIIKIRTDKKTRAFVDALPVLPQADMEFIKLAEAMRNRGESRGLIGKVAHALEDAQDFLGRKADFIFRGKERIVSAADRMYSRSTALASIYKQARDYGMTGDQLVYELTEGTILTPQQRAKVYERVSQDLSKLYNSVAPHLMRDLFASSNIGRHLASYSTPQRRNARIFWDLLRSDNPKDKIRATIAMTMQLGMSGRGVIPKTVQGALLLMATQTGAQYIEGALQELDKANVLRRSTGLDLSDRMGFDAVNVAGPQIDQLLHFFEKSYKIATKETGVQAGMDIAGLALFETMSMLPRIGPFGFDVWAKLVRNLDAAKKNEKTYWFATPNGLKAINVKGYTYYDALRDWAIPGLPPKVEAAQQEIRMNSAKKMDASKGRAIIPEASSGSQWSPIPNPNQEG